jgi:hypothetical protein
MLPAALTIVPAVLRDKWRHAEGTRKSNVICFFSESISRLPPPTTIQLPCRNSRGIVRHRIRAARVIQAFLKAKLWSLVDTYYIVDQIADRQIVLESGLARVECGLASGLQGRGKYR